MLYVDNIVLDVETSEEANAKVEEWRAIFESKRLRISRTKTEYLRWSTFQSNGKIDGDVTHCIKASLLKWRAATRVLRDKKFSIRLKSKFYRVVIRPTLLYGSKC
ncbi:uncharacterized protein LOC130818484 [Amaranthus tricolor]|uniref:uncharacterized protein LOC130818484 n=1 Tax=Amaranthus tricolor TaxID=29722 RepID=UPI0025881ACF|nr:uncharacterized protein LOC130818484 [Amaranthus tricolor]